MRWIHFVLSLVKAAERIAAAPAEPASCASVNEVSFPQREAAKDSPRTGTIAEQYDSFFDILKFEDDSKRYWMGKFLELNADGPRASGGVGVRIEREKMRTERLVIPEKYCPDDVDRMTCGERVGSEDEEGEEEEDEGGVRMKGRTFGQEGVERGGDGAGRGLNFVPAFRDGGGG